MAEKGFGDMVKAVVDIEKEIMAVGGDFHSEASELLVKEGSNQEKVWGINIYPNETEDDFVVFDSMINIKPLLNNKSLYIEDESIRKKIKDIVNKLIEK